MSHRKTDSDSLLPQKTGDFEADVWAVWAAILSSRMEILASLFESSRTKSFSATGQVTSPIVRSCHSTPEQPHDTSHGPSHYCPLASETFQTGSCGLQWCLLKCSIIRLLSHYDTLSTNQIWFYSDVPYSQIPLCRREKLRKTLDVTQSGQKKKRKKS